MNRRRGNLKVELKTEEKMDSRLRGNDRRREPARGRRYVVARE